MWSFAPSFILHASQNCSCQARRLPWRQFRHHNLVFAYIQKHLLSTQVVDAFDTPTRELLLKNKFIIKPGQATDTHLGVLSLEFLNNVKKMWWGEFVDHDCSFTKLEISDDDNVYRNEKYILETIITPKWKEMIASNTCKDIPNTAVNVVSKGGENDGVLLITPIENSTTEIVHDEHVSKQLRFFKNFLCKPAELVAESQNNAKSNASTMAFYKHKDSKLNVFKCVLMNGDEKLSGWNEVTSAFGKQQVFCLVYVDMTSMLCSLFIDAYHKISFPNYQATMLRLHPHIAPVKVAVMVEDKNDVNLIEVADYLIAKIREMNVNCWNANEMDLTPVDLDHSGVMYCVIIKYASLGNGLVFIRNRDTSIEMPVHISQVLEKLHLYLSPR